MELELLLAQVSVREARADTTPNCGNLLAPVAPLGIETGWVRASDPVTRVRVLTRDTGTRSEIEVQTPGGRVE